MQVSLRDLVSGQAQHILRGASEGVEAEGAGETGAGVETEGALFSTEHSVDLFSEVQVILKEEREEQLINEREWDE
jgi:hypothetical protein